MVEFVIRIVNGRETFAVDHLGKKWLESALFSTEHRIVLTPEQSTWALSDLRQAYEFGMLG